MEVDRLRHAVLDLEAALWAHLVLSDLLPRVATGLLLDGADSEALVALAGLDVGPFDSGDAQDSLRRLMEEQSLVPQDDDRLRRAVALLAVGLLREVLSVDQCLRHAEQLAVTSEYPDDPDLMALYGLRDEWGAGWGRGDEEVSESAREAARRIAQRGDRPEELVVAIVGRRR